MRLATLCKRLEKIQRNEKTLSRPLTLRQIFCLKLIEQGKATTSEIGSALGMDAASFRESLLTMLKEHPQNKRPGLGLIESTRITSSTRPYICLEYSLTKKGKTALRDLAPLFVGIK